MSVIGLAAVRLIETPFFRKPSDSLLASLTGFFALWTIDLSGTEPQALLNDIRWGSILYLVVIFGVSIASVTLLRSRTSNDAPRAFFYRVSTRLGAPELLFTPLVLISLIGFHDIGSASGIILAGVWLLLVVVRPIEEVISLMVTWRKSS